MGWIDLSRTLSLLLAFSYYYRIGLLSYHTFASADQREKYEGKVVKGNRNALFLIKKGRKKMFPDFNTFVKMGFNTSVIMKIPDDILQSIPAGAVIEPIPVFRPDDYMYHQVCDDPDRLVNDLGVIVNMGDFNRFLSVLRRVKQRKRLEMVALGGSITAGGYFLEFVRNLQQKAQLEVSYHNHGHGATELTYTIFCVDIEKYAPDLVMIDFAVNDYGHPKLMDALVRKVLAMPSRPVVLLVNFWVMKHCPTPRYLLHSYYYQLPLINLCAAVNTCYGKNHLPKELWEQYSQTDGVHPWGVNGVKFIGDILYAWWHRFDQAVSFDVTMDNDGKQHQHVHSYDSISSSSSGNSGTAVRQLSSSDSYQQQHSQLQQQQQQQQQQRQLQYHQPQQQKQRRKFKLNGIRNHKTPSSSISSDSSSDLEFTTEVVLPPPLYASNPIGLCTRCEALADDADAVLQPLRQPSGFRIVTRMKIGYGGFNPAEKTSATKSFKRSWQADTPGAEIAFQFFGSTVKIAIWQRRDGMGVLNAFVDGDRSNIAKASGFFKGYTWAMEKNNTGRSEIMPLFEGLADSVHELTLVVGNESANPWVKGHLVQVFAILSASDNLGCKNVTLAKQMTAAEALELTVTSTATSTAATTANNIISR